MSEFGYHPGTDPTTTDNISSNVIWAKATSLPSAGDLTTISVFCKIRAGTPTIKVAIYSDNAGVPGTLLADSGATVGTPAAGLAYVTVACSFTLVASTQYWFAVIVPLGLTPTLDVDWGFDTNGSLTEGYFKVNGGSPGNTTFLANGSGASGFANERFAVYGTYTPAGGGDLSALIGEPITGSSQIEGGLR